MEKAVDRKWGLVGIRVRLSRVCPYGPLEMFDLGSMQTGSCTGNGDG